MRVFSNTDIGKVRTSNEDNIFYTLENIGVLDNLFLLCDGMGGANAGEYASKKAIEYISEFFEKDEYPFPEILTKAIEYSNAKILEEASKDFNKSGMGTTLVLATIKDKILYVANIGDSRLYILNENLKQITKDHNLYQELSDLDYQKRIDFDKIKTKNALTRVIGVLTNIKIDFFEIEISNIDKILICSDGLTNMLSDKEIEDILCESKHIDFAKVLVDKANENGGKDNISVLVIDGIR